MDITRQLMERFGVTDFERKREDLVFATLPGDRLVDALSWLKRSAGFTHLVLLTAVDWMEAGHFQLTYILNNPAERWDLALRVMRNRTEPVMDSIHHLWAQAATYQRELREKFGIRFPGSPGLDEDFILEGWTGIPPYRRDFDTRKYSEETYFPRPGRSTRDPREHMAKGYPEEES